MLNINYIPLYVRSILKQQNMCYPFTTDNRSKLKIDCLLADYTYNRSTYRNERLKISYIGISISVVCVLIMMYCNCDLMKNISSVLLGASLSLVIWYGTTKHQDVINHELNIIDSCIDSIDTYIGELHSGIHIINPQIAKHDYLDGKNENYRLFRLASVVESLKRDQNINNERLELKWFDFSNVSVKEYLSRWYEVIDDMSVLKQFTSDDILQINHYNEYTIERELLNTKEYLRNCKSYVLFGNVPIKDVDLDEYMKNADRIDILLKKTKKER